VTKDTDQHKEIKMTKDNHEDGDKLEQTIHDLFYKGPLGLRNKLEEFLETIVDAGTSIDSGFGDLSGCGNDCAELFPVIGGVEYRIAITAGDKPMTAARAQEIAKELALDPTVQRTGRGTVVPVAALKRAMENKRKDDD
jgi:hypothetical protein